MDWELTGSEGSTENCREAPCPKPQTESYSRGHHLESRKGIGEPRAQLPVREFSGRHNREDCTCSEAEGEKGIKGFGSGVLPMFLQEKKSCGLLPS